MTTTSPKKTQAELLEEEFPVEALKDMKKGNATLTYIPVSEVEKRLNDVLGVCGWSVIECDSWRDKEDPDWIIGKCVLEATVDGSTARRIGYGGQKIKYYNSGDGAIDLGDEFKGASSDAKKKAAQGFGVGLYLARAEEMRLLEAENAKERADAEAINLLKGQILTLAEDKQEELKTFWKSQKYPKIDSGNLTVEQVETLTERFNLDV